MLGCMYEIFLVVVESVAGPERCDWAGGAGGRMDRGTLVD